MKYKFWTKQKLFFISVSILILAIITLYLIFINVSFNILLCLWCAFFCPLFMYMIYDYKMKSDFYKETITTLNQLDEKYIIANIIESPEFQEGKIFCELLYIAGKSMAEKINNHKNSQNEYKEYIEKWVHEIKTPIAAIHLLLENNDDKSYIFE